jgi:CrcB protein
VDAAQEREGASVVMLLFVVVGAAIGAPLRYVTDRAIQTRHRSLMPWGTLAVNLVGCFALGTLGGAAVNTGLCGALTTYSTFGYETLRLLQERASLHVVVNVVCSVVGGVTAYSLGHVMVAALFS